MAKVKKWHIASAVAVIAIIVLIIVLVSRRGSRLDAPNMPQCPAIPLGDPMTSYTQSSNCTVMCMTSDSNASVSQDASGACRSGCVPGYVKSLTTGLCTVSVQASQSTVDNLKLQLMNITDPKMKSQLSDQITMLQRRIDSLKTTPPMPPKTSPPMPPKTSQPMTT